MKPQSETRTLTLSGGLRKARFRIGTRTQGHIMRILRNTLYKWKVLAVEREYGANAWDAHRAAGKPDLPIKVSLPTELESSFTVRDWGPGLRMGDPDETQEESDRLGPSVFTTFVVLGESARRDDDEEVGSFGIGGKCGHAYNDTFTITSWHGGTRRVYHAVLVEDDEADLILLHESSLGKYIRDFLLSEGSTADLSELVDNEYCDLYGYMGDDEETEETDKVVLLSGEHPSRLARFEAWLQRNAPDAETGLEVKVPVNPGDIPEFHEEARKLYRYFKPLPDINIDLKPPVPSWESANGFLMTRDRNSRYEDDWVVVMGCVPYPMEVVHVRQALEDAGVSEGLTALKGGLYCRIGEVAVVASREGLEYTQRTRDALVARFIALFEDARDELKQVVNDPKKSDWERRLGVRDFYTRTSIPLTPQFKPWASDAVKGVPLYSNELIASDEAAAKKEERPQKRDVPEFFRLQKQETSWGRTIKTVNLTGTRRVPVSAETRLLVRDTTQPWRGYVEMNDMVVALQSGATVEKAEKELAKRLAAANLTGVPVLRMSTLPYTAPVQKPRSAQEMAQEQKYDQRCFLLLPGAYSERAVKSNNWEIATRVPDQDDVYVILSRFIPTTADRDFFYRRVDRTRRVLKELFGLDMPPIYGIKTTQGEPTLPADVVGTPYLEWEQKILREAYNLSPEVQALWQAMAWGDVSLDCRWQSPKTSPKKTREFLNSHFHGLHSLVQYYNRWLDANKLSQQVAAKRGVLDILGTVINLAGGTGPEVALQRITERFPLLGHNSYGMGLFRDKTQRDHWVQYVNLIEKG